MASNIPAQPSSPGLPSPGPAPQDAAAPLPLLTYSTGPSPCQNAANLTAVGGNPGSAGPIVVTPTTQFQDLGQVMGQTGNFPPPSTAAGGSP